MLTRKKFVAVFLFTIGFSTFALPASAATTPIILPSATGTYSQWTPARVVPTTPWWTMLILRTTTPATLSNPFHLKQKQLRWRGLMKQEHHLMQALKLSSFLKNIADLSVMFFVA